MKVVCLQEKLQQGIERVERVAGKNATLPILQNILLETETGGLKLTTTDLEMGITARIIGKVEEEGSITVPAKLLSSFLSVVSRKKIILSAKEAVLTLKTESHKTTILGEQKDNFPLLPRIKRKNSFSLARGEMRKGLSFVEKASALSDSRPELTGVYVRYANNTILFAATDSFRLAEAVIPASEAVREAFSFILPARTVQELIRILSSREEGERHDTIVCFIENNQILFEINETQIISRLIEGEYPNYQSIIPKSFEVEVAFEREPFLQELKASSLFAGRNNEIKLEIDSENSQITMYAENAGVGESSSRLSVSSLRKGKTRTIAFNYKYLIDGLSDIQSEKVLLKANSEINPVLVTPSPETSHRYLVMPVRTA